MALLIYYHAKVKEYDDSESVCHGLSYIYMQVIFYLFVSLVNSLFYII